MGCWRRSGLRTCPAKSDGHGITRGLIDAIYEVKVGIVFVSERTPLVRHQPAVPRLRTGQRPRFVRESPRRVDPTLAGEVAARFQSARSDRINATVRAAYEQLERQSDAIFIRLTNPDSPFPRGLRVKFTLCEAPYDSDDELIGAVRTHGVLEVATSARERERRHPLLGCDLGGSYDRFRSVHDIVGHVGPCLGFDPRRGIRGLVDSGATLRRTRPMGSGYRASRGALRLVDHRNAFGPQGNSYRPESSQQGPHRFTNRHGQLRAIDFGAYEDLESQGTTTEKRALNWGRRQRGGEQMSQETEKAVLAGGCFGACRT